MRIPLFDSSINWMFLEFEYWWGCLDSVMLILEMKHMVPKSPQNSAEFPIVCMIWYCWIQSSAMCKSKMYDDVVFDDPFRYQLTYVWSVCIDTDISTPWYSIAYKYLYKTSPLITGLMREAMYQSGLQWAASLDGDNRYMDGRREWEDIGNSSEIWDICIYIYIYIYIYIIFLTYLYSYSITYIIP